MFDEQIKPAYTEDQDMHWRIILEGYKAVGYEGARFYHYGSRTIKSDPVLLEANHISHDRNMKYFIRKWGDRPDTMADPFKTERMFRTPFNRGWK
jgi:GT2 family glycosyltransferase